MARDLQAFYAAQRRLHEAAGVEWDALGGALAPFSLDGDVEAWAAGAAADLVARDGKARAYAAPALCDAAMRDGVLLAPVPGRVTAAFAHRHPEREHEVALGYGFEPSQAQDLLLQAGRAVAFEAFETPGSTSAPAVAAHVLRTACASLHGWCPSVRQARLVQVREETYG